ncbi:MAG: nuclear transport factor 2 family protein [Bacteroidales bacterium]|jgi:ketosteroid isomerase-like protein|nr:nuclear transport factor 2 family protein [Bacteroidales bacterium]
MRKTVFLLTLSLFAVCCNTTQQQPEPAAALPQTSAADVEAAVNQLMAGMIAADENILQAITADELVYGHSAGKVQNKAEFIAEVLSKQPLVYLSITPLEQTIQMSGETAVVRHILTAETQTPEGVAGNLNVGNVLVWKLQDGTWKLLARQAYRMN